MLRSAAERLPNVAAVRYHLGMVYAALGQNDLATENLTKAVDLAKDTDFPQAASARAVLSAMAALPKSGEQSGSPVVLPGVIPPADIETGERQPQG